MLDVAIVGGRLVDGTGAPPVAATVGIADGRVAVVAGPGDDVPARRTVDADGLVVAPGFVDVHTHFDAQLFWDPALTPSSLHGVTTVFAGNCGFSIAPVGDDPSYLLRLLARVEGIPLPALEAGVPWSWRTFADYLGAVERSGVALNIGFLVGHSAIRRAVLGERSHEAEPTPDELAAMRALLGDGLEAGGFGFSSSWGTNHLDGDGNPVPSRLAGAAELVALAEVVADHPGAQLEFIPTNGAFEPEHLEVMTAMALAGKAPLNWNILVPRDAEWTANRLSASDHAAARGARVVGLSYPDVIRGRHSFVSSGFDAIPGWALVMTRPEAEKLALLADPAVRATLRAGLDSPVGRQRQLDAMVVTDSRSRPELVGRVTGEVASEEGVDLVDLLCDLAVADSLRTVFAAAPIADDAAAWAARETTWTDDRVVIGASDAGAHLDVLATFDYPARYLALQRERGAVPLEQVVRQLTSVPASLYGLADRGVLAPGTRADVVVLDPGAVEPGAVEWRDDLPGGAGRLYAEPRGIARVMVNGVDVVVDGRLTGAVPGQVLRRGVDAPVAGA